MSWKTASLDLNAHTPSSNLQKGLFLKYNYSLEVTSPQQVSIPVNFYITSLLSPSEIIDLDSVLNHKPSPALLPKFQLTTLTVSNTERP